MRIIRNVSVVIIMLVCCYSVEAHKGWQYDGLYYKNTQGDGTTLNSAWLSAQAWSQHLASHTDRNYGLVAPVIGADGRVSLSYWGNNLIFMWWVTCADTVFKTRNYTGQSLASSLGSYDSNVDIGTSTCIPSNEVPCDSLLIYSVCCAELGYVAYWLDTSNNNVFVTGQAPCDDGVYDCLQLSEFSSCMSTPTPTPAIPPTLTPPPPTPVITPTPIGTPVSSPVPTPTPNTTNPPQSTPVPTSTPYQYPQPIYNSTVVPVPTNDGEVKETNIDDIEYDTSVPDVGQGLTEDDTWLDTIFNLFTNHPLIDVIKNSTITTSGELCKLSVNLYGKTIEISFCDLTGYVEIFGYFVTVCASIYAYFIIFRVS